jgi:hypothetical protein
MNGDEQASNRTRIFVSHSHSDVEIAKKLIEVIETGLKIPEHAIRCTSVPGYRLEGGDDAPEVLRRNLRESSVVLGLLTRSSLDSECVLMELGAAWALEKLAIPLLGPGTSLGALPGFFRDLHALKISEPPDLASLIGTIAKHTQLAKKDNAARHWDALNGLVKAVIQPAAASSSPADRNPSAERSLRESNAQVELRDFVAPAFTPLVDNLVTLFRKAVGDSRPEPENRDEGEQRRPK